ncbi:MAG: hypothetical protein WCG12_20445 [Alcaligenaceae bacterium]
MNLAYFKDRFHNTESAYLLARRANNSGLNPFARQAIEQIITERGERLPALVFNNKAESQSLKDSKVYKLWRYIHAMPKVFAMKAMDVGRNTRFFAVLPIGALVVAIALSDVATPLKTFFEDATSSPRWYVYGLISNSDFDNLQKELVPYNIKVMSRGCIVDGDEYKKDIQNNQRVYEAASEDLKRLLGKPRFKS